MDMSRTEPSREWLILSVTAKCFTGVPLLFISKYSTTLHYLGFTLSLLLVFFLIFFVISAFPYWFWLLWVHFYFFFWWFGNNREIQVCKPSGRQLKNYNFMILFVDIKENIMECTVYPPEWHCHSVNVLEAKGRAGLPQHLFQRQELQNCPG